MIGVSAESGAVRSTTSTAPLLKPSASVARIDMEVPSTRWRGPTEHSPARCSPGDPRGCNLVLFRSVDARRGGGIRSWYEPLAREDGHAHRGCRRWPRRPVLLRPGEATRPL